ncbi:MAG: XTP/dITP diphosphatase, partial [Deltaproteobacteria bacterium]|nr:XTP/dITP diphosphatase [Deltaproteobacteria bacterium]
METLKARQKDAPKEVVIATRNLGKLREMEAILDPLSLKLLSLKDFPEIPEVVEDGTTFAENAGKKARTIARLTGRFAIADDSGICVDALQGRPGIFSSRFAGEEASDRERYQKLLDEMTGVPEGQRGAEFICVMAIVSPEGEMQTVEEKCRGRITFTPQGKHGFGFDPIFFVPEFGKTMAELEPEAKNQIS